MQNGTSVSRSKLLFAEQRVMLHRVWEKCTEGGRQRSPARSIRKNAVKQRAKGQSRENYKHDKAGTNGFGLGQEHQPKNVPSKLIAIVDTQSSGTSFLHTAMEMQSQSQTGGSDGRSVVLVTGGFGLVGMAIRHVLEADKVAALLSRSLLVDDPRTHAFSLSRFLARQAALPGEEWIFVGSKDCDLRCAPAAASV
jgi:hypothetical protein